MRARPRSLSTLASALLIFGLAGGVMAFLIPQGFRGGTTPGFAVFFVSGVAFILLTAALFGYIARLNMGFGRTALVLAVGYNALIAAVKLGLAPAALYEANREQDFDTTFGDPNSPVFYVGVGVAVLLLYAGVFRAMYGFFKRRFRRRRVDATPAEVAGRRGTSRMRLVVVSVVVVVVGVSVSWFPLLFVAAPALTYLSYVFTAFGVAIAAALVLAAVLAFRAFEEVEKQAFRLGDATLLASFFWLGLVMIALYHAMWAVFLLALVSIWPFRTYTPK